MLTKWLRWSTASNHLIIRRFIQWLRGIRNFIIRIVESVVVLAVRFIDFDGELVLGRLFQGSSDGLYFQVLHGDREAILGKLRAFDTAPAQSLTNVPYEMADVERCKPGVRFKWNRHELLVIRKMPMSNVLEEQIQGFVIIKKRNHDDVDVFLDGLTSVRLVLLALLLEFHAELVPRLARLRRLWGSLAITSRAVDIAPNEGTVTGNKVAR